MAGLGLIVGNRAYSSWSVGAWLCLKATGADFEEDVIPLFEPGSAERICAISPAGQVPVLIDGDIVIPDSLAIAEYLAEAFPAAGLWPEDRAARAAARSACAEMHAGFPALRAGLPMNVRKHLPGVADMEAARGDIDRVCRIWRGCRERFGMGGPFLFGGCSNAAAFYGPVGCWFVRSATPRLTGTCSFPAGLRAPAALVPDGFFRGRPRRRTEKRLSSTLARNSSR